MIGRAAGVLICLVVSLMGFKEASGSLINSDGIIYVGAGNSSTVARYDAMTGAFIDNLFGIVGPVGGLAASATVSAVPLPAALPLFLSALAGLGLMGWRRRQAAA